MSSIMSTKKCRECGIIKNAVKDFYPNTGLLCKKCKMAKDNERAKDTRTNNTTLLLQLIEMNKTMVSEIEELRDEVQSMRKKLKKITS